jgi:hypothetical protein
MSHLQNVIDNTYQHSCSRYDGRYLCNINHYRHLLRRLFCFGSAITFPQSLDLVCFVVTFYKQQSTSSPWRWDLFFIWFWQYLHDVTNYKSSTHDVGIEGSRTIQQDYHAICTPQSKVTYCDPRQDYQH